VRRLLHHQTRELDGIFDVMELRHRAGAPGGAVHDGGIELADAVVVEYRALAGVELRIVLHGAHRRPHRIQRRAAALEHRVAGIESRPESGAERGLALGCHVGTLDDARAAVDDDHHGVLGGGRRCAAEKCGGGE
jgi:hypothetical protein